MLCIDPRALLIGFVEALAKNSKNNKALFRKAKALGELGFFERADKIFKELIEADPPGAHFLSMYLA